MEFKKASRDTNFDDLIAMFKKWPEVDGLHSHVGSQGVDLHLMVGGVKFVVDLADQLNQHLQRKQVNLILLNCIIDRYVLLILVVVFLLIIKVMIVII